MKYVLPTRPWDVCEMMHGDNIPGGFDIAHTVSAHVSSIDVDQNISIVVYATNRVSKHLVASLKVELSHLMQSLLCCELIDSVSNLCCSFF